MVSTLGEAFDAGWRLRARCAGGKRDGMKSARLCTEMYELELATLVWTRGCEFPLALAEEASERLATPGNAVPGASSCSSNRRQREPAQDDGGAGE